MFAAFAAAPACAITANPAQPACERQWERVASRPHDASHFTQGLLMTAGRLFESTGRYGNSALIEVDPDNGQPLRRYRLPPSEFGEGLALVGGTLIQLTWREQRARLYDLQLKLLDTRPIRGEGWGLTTRLDEHGQPVALIQSDGSDQLHRLHPLTLRRQGSITVRQDGKPVTRLNELEFVAGEVLANIWFQNRVVAIDPDTGIVRGWYDFSALQDELPSTWRRGSPDAVMNGIAVDERSGHLLITGKLWPTLFEVKAGGCRQGAGDR